VTESGSPEHEQRRAARHGNRWATDDDLVAGLDRAGRPRGLRAFFATTLAASLLVWDLAYQLGAYHTVFYSRLFQVFVVSTVLLLGSIVLRHDVRVRKWSRVLLAVPMLWLLVRLIAEARHESQPQRVVDVVMGALTLASVPFILWAAARIVSPEYFQLQRRRLKATAVGIVAVVAVAGFLIGQFNYAFTTCQDYVVAGDNQPDNCNRGSDQHPNRP
jgi:hypothetical protein